MSLRDEVFRPLEPLPTIASRQALIDRIAREVDEYLANGGTITRLGNETSEQRSKVAIGQFTSEKRKKTIFNITAENIEAVQRAVELAGGTRTVASKLSVRRETVTNWCRGHRPVSPDRAIDLERLSGQQVKRSEMTPTVQGHV